MAVSPSGQPMTASPLSLPKLALCYGTRPQVIKASVLLETLRARAPVVAIDSGQHYDFELNELLYRQLGVPRPDHFLEVGSGPAVEQTAAVMGRTVEILRRERPAAVLVIGDTNSTLGAALAANKEGLPLVHVEAGLRAQEPNLPEEANRRVVDVLSQLLLAPCESAATRLRAESMPGRVVTTGDVARDVLVRHLQLAPAPSGGPPFVLATAHRAALTSDPAALAALLQALGELELAVVLPLHPRTRQALDRHGLLSSIPPTVRLVAPLGYLDMIAAIRDAQAVVTDSGGVQREAYWLGTPCVTLREETEWVETVALGANALLRPRAAPGVLPALLQSLLVGRGAWDRTAYGDGHAADLVLRALTGWV
jgi:UDP-N-acetylglucosamine 2-epimerase